MLECGANNYNVVMAMSAAAMAYGYELRLSLERLWALILAKVIGGWQERHLVQKNAHCSSKSPN